MTISHSSRYSSCSGISCLGSGEPSLVLALVDQVQRRDVVPPDPLQRLGARQRSRLRERLDPHPREAGVLELGRSVGAPGNRARSISATDGKSSFSQYPSKWSGSNVAITILPPGTSTRPASASARGRSRWCSESRMTTRSNHPSLNGSASAAPSLNRAAFPSPAPRRASPARSRPPRPCPRAPRARRQACRCRTRRRACGGRPGLPRLRAGRRAPTTSRLPAAAGRTSPRSRRSATRPV